MIRRSRMLIFLACATIALARAGNFVTVEEAMVEQADIAASNGVVHVVDRVMMPPKKK